ncbi:SgcJ/EcaC family oxidoreductase [Thalassobacillus devorans]|uniref:SgcJ/EcaC family oxidoreductase n=1 Tax=Thalassobacillus devorans TaxID=279813 RepID=UPI00048CE030|nr:SgcJ/EcaC family oxidoreductase [Thalassobacillus devorans]
MENKEQQVRKLYEQLISAWNRRNAKGMADLFSKNGESIGFDGSQSQGPEEIFSHLDPVFRDHPTAPYVTKIKEIRFLGEDIAIVRAIAGMVPPGESDIKPEVNTHQTLLLSFQNGKWNIELFQNTPAQFHGRPELVEKMSAELRELL